MPDIEAWLALPREELAQIVQTHKLTVALSIDGSRRYHLLHRGEITDFAAYAEFIGKAMVRVYDLVYSLGVETILTIVMLPPNFQRPDNYAQKVVAQSFPLFLGQDFSGLYQKYNLRARLFGDYDLAPAEVIKTKLNELNQALVKLSGSGERSLLLGYYQKSFVEEIATRATLLSQALGRPPDFKELREAGFPAGPEKLNISISAGWLRVGGIIPPVLDAGETDLYNLAYLSLDLEESTLRSILYDHLYLRQVTNDDILQYSQADLAILREYYRQNSGKLIGLGKLVGPGLWYAKVAE